MNEDTLPVLHASEIACKSVFQEACKGQLMVLHAPAVCGVHQKHSWHRGMKDSVRSSPSWWQERHTWWRAASHSYSNENGTACGIR